MTAFYGLQGHTLNMENVVVFPMGFHPYGLDVAANNANMSNADILLTNMDAWVVDPAGFASTRWVPWFPVDSEPMPKAIEMRVRSAFDRIVYTQFAVNECKKVDLDCHYVPMGVNTNQIRPVDRKAALEEMNLHIPVKIDPDKFIVSMVAMNKGNPSRKAFLQQIRAFKELHDHHPDTVLYLHTGKCENGEMQGINLPPYIKNLGLEKDVFFPDLQIMINGYPGEFMNAVYNASDVLTSVSMGEGFGLPILEAQSAGCPVIVGDWTSMPELLFSGWKVDRKDTSPWWSFLDNYMFDPHWQAIYEQMELAYAARGDQSIRDKAREGALAFDADLITEKYWKPVLEKIDEKVQEDKRQKAIVAVPQPYEDNDTLIIQHCSKNSEHALQMGLTAERNIAYCRDHKMDYQAIMADIDNFIGENVGWAKIALLQKAMKLHYKNIIWLDADTIIADTTSDLRTACTLDKVGAVWHELHQGGAILKHWNVGVLFVSNTEKTRDFVDKWLARFPGTREFPWYEQGEFNKLGEEMGIIQTVGAEYNCVDYVNPHPKPIIMGFHGYGDRLNVMKAAMKKLE